MDSIEEKLEKLGRQLEVAEEGFKQEVVAAAKNELLPELAQLKADLNKRLDDFNAHLLDQSRRIDALREGVGGRIDTLRQELVGRIESMRNIFREELQLAVQVQALQKDVEDLKRRVNKIA